jgi:hypothetical protein
MALGQRPRRRPTIPDTDDPLGLFRDGPPTWTINAGKAWQRPSSTARDAKKHCDATVSKLRWHGNHVALLAGNHTPTSLAALALADKLEACAPPRNPCLSGACPICTRAQQRWFVTETLHVLRPLIRDPNYRPQVLSLVPEFGRIPAGSLDAYDIDAFRGSVREALNSRGINHYKLGVDISLNQRAGVARPLWQLQCWGFFHPPKRLWRERLKAHLNPNGGVTRPVKVVKPDSLEAAAAYGLKNTFVRRLSYRKENLDREDRGECWNTRDRILRGDEWVELMLFLDRIGLQRRIMLSGRALSLRPLHSPNAPQFGGSK